MGGQVEEGDLPAAVARDAHGIREQFPHRLFQPHLAACHHIGQEGGGEGLGNGADFEERAPIEREPAHPGAAVGDDARAALVEQSHHDPRVAAGVDALANEAEDHAVGGELAGGGEEWGQGQGQEQRWNEGGGGAGGRGGAGGQGIQFAERRGMT